MECFSFSSWGRVWHMSSARRLWGARSNIVSSLLNILFTGRLTKIAGVFTIQKQCVYFLSFLYFLKQLFPSLYPAGVSEYPLQPGNGGGDSSFSALGVTARLAKHLLQAGLWGAAVGGGHSTQCKGGQTGWAKRNGGRKGESWGPENRVKTRRSVRRRIRSRKRGQRF